MNEFIKELIRLTGVSEQYANAAWFTLSRRDKPKTRALWYARQFKLIK